MTFFLFIIAPVLSYDEFIDDVVLYENYLICIFMNKTVKSEEKRGKNISIARFWIGYKISILYPWDKFSRLSVFSEGLFEIVSSAMKTKNNNNICMM